MLDRLLFFLSDNQVEAVYDWGIEILDKFFRTQDRTQSSTQFKGIQLITQIADLANLTVTIKRN